jgi:dTDP-4-dehydrorhamnose 3,5-epimerase
MKLEFDKIEKSELILVRMDTHSDERGEVSEIYNREQFYTGGIYDDFIHEVENYSHFNTIRGLHYQAKENAISKLIRVVVGCYRCVFVDIRQSSDNYGCMYSYMLEDLKEMIYVPIGYALGIQALHHDNHFIYKMSKTYNHKYARSINPTKGIESLVDSENNSLSFIYKKNIIKNLSRFQNTGALSNIYSLNSDNPMRWINPSVSDKDDNAPTWEDYLKNPEY